MNAAAIKCCLLGIVIVANANALEITELEAPSQNDHFLTLSADCTQFQPNGTIGLVLHTSEPFYGSIYSRNHQSTCKVKGNGETATKLIISSDKECGVRKIHDKRNLVTATTSQVLNKGGIHRDVPIWFSIVEKYRVRRRSIETNYRVVQADFVCLKKGVPFEWLEKLSISNQESFKCEITI